MSGGGGDGVSWPAAGWERTRNGTKTATLRKIRPEARAHLPNGAPRPARHAGAASPTIRRKPSRHRNLAPTRCASPFSVLTPTGAQPRTMACKNPAPDSDQRPWSRKAFRPALEPPCQRPARVHVPRVSIWTGTTLLIRLPAVSPTRKIHATPVARLLPLGGWWRARWARSTTARRSGPSEGGSWS